MVCFSIKHWNHNCGINTDFCPLDGYKGIHPLWTIFILYINLFSVNFIQTQWIILSLSWGHWAQGTRWDTLGGTMHTVHTFTQSFTPLGNVTYFWETGELLRTWTKPTWTQTERVPHREYTELRIKLRTLELWGDTCYTTVHSWNHVVYSTRFEKNGY